MKELKFKTNINCTGCLSKVTPILNVEGNISKWKVDLQSEERVLTVKTSILSEKQIKNLVQKVGFTAEEIEA